MHLIKEPQNINAQIKLQTLREIEMCNHSGRLLHTYFNNWKNKQKASRNIENINNRINKQTEWTHFPQLHFKLQKLYFFLKCTWNIYKNWPSAVWVIYKSLSCIFLFYSYSYFCLIFPQSGGSLSRALKTSMVSETEDLFISYFTIYFFYF